MKQTTLLMTLMLFLSTACNKEKVQEEKIGHDKEHAHVESGNMDHEHAQEHHEDHDHKAHHPEHQD